VGPEEAGRDARGEEGGRGEAEGPERVGGREERDEDGAHAGEDGDETLRAH
jgi:hypothetical protein